MNPTNPANQATAPQIRSVHAALSDPAVRRRYRDTPKAAHQELLLLAGERSEIPGDVEIKAVFNTADTTYIAFPAIGGEHEIGDAEVGDADLSRMAAAGSAGTAGSVGSFSSVGTVCSTMSTGGSFATLGTIASG